jgi:hypothetical protein
MYTKAITAFITSALGMFVVLGVEISWLTSEFVAAIAVVINTGLVYLLPNKL